MPSRLSEASLRKHEIGKAAAGAAVRENGRGRHEPEPADIVVDALGVRGVVAVIARDAREEVLEALAGHQIAVGQGGATEIGDSRVAAAIDANLMATLHLHCVEHGGPPTTG